MGMKIWRAVVIGGLLLSILAFINSLNWFLKDSQFLKVRRTSRLVNSGVDALAVSSDSKYIAAGDDRRFVGFMNLSGRVFWQYSLGLHETHAVTAVAASRGGRRVAAGSADGLIYLFDTNATPLQRFQVPGAVTGLGFSGDGAHLLAGTGGGRFYHFVNGNLTGEQQRAGTISKLETDDSGRRVLILADKKMSLLVDEATAWEKNDLKSAALSTNGRYVLTLSTNNQLELFKADGKRLWRRSVLKNFGGAKDFKITSVSANGYSALANERRVIFLNRKGNKLASYRSPKEKVLSVSMSNSGKRLILGTQKVLIISTEDAIKAASLRILINKSLMPAGLIFAALLSIAALIYRFRPVAVPQADYATSEPEEESDNGRLAA